MSGIIKLKRSVIPACDVRSTKDFKKLVEQTYEVTGIGGYKIGSLLTITYGLP